MKRFYKIEKCEQTINEARDLMKRAILQFAKDAEVPVRTDYSGRFMHGKQCLAIELNDDMARDLFIITRYIESMSDGKHWLGEVAIDLLFRERNEDSKGWERFGWIVYWPSLQL